MSPRLDPIYQPWIDRTNDDWCKNRVASPAETQATAWRDWYNCAQQSHESVLEYGQRLETILGRMEEPPSIKDQFMKLKMCANEIVRRDFERATSQNS